MVDRDKQQTQPRAAMPRDPMVVAVVALGLTQIITWGTTLYALGVLGGPIARDTGWSQTLVYGGLTSALLASSVISAWAGRAIDRRGGRLVMSIGSVLVAAGLAALAVTTSPFAYLTVWACLGLAMRLTLYDAAFAALVQVTPTRGRRAISYLTLFGGVASTVFWPIGYWLEARYGWRVTLMVFAAINLVVCLPLHWFGLARRDPTPPAAASSAQEAGVSHGAVLEGTTRRLAMLLFGFVMAASAFCYGALAVHLITAIGLAGVPTVTAVTLASLKGVAQTLSRLGDLVFGKSLHPVTLGRLTLAFLPASFAVLLWGGTGFATAFAFTMLFGIANGLTTIVRGAVPLALFGPKGYGEVLGLLATPYLVFNALAPMVFAWIADAFSVTAAMYLVFATGLIAWVSIEIMAWWHRGVLRQQAAGG